MSLGFLENAALVSGRAIEIPAADFGGVLDVVTAPVKAAAKVVSGGGKAIVSGGKALVEGSIDVIDKTTGVITDAARAIPIVGGPLGDVLHASTSLAKGPITLSQSIIKGERLDKAIIGHIAEQIKHVKTVGPYAQMVVTLVPGVGTGVGAALGAGLALAEGQSISDAMVAGVEGSIPGGPIAQAAFRVTYAAASGKPIDEAAVKALPITPEQQQMVLQGARAVKDISEGKRVDHTLFNRGQQFLPPEAQTAMQVAGALAHGKQIQQLAMKTPGAVANAIGAVGSAVATGTAVAEQRPPVMATLQATPSAAIKQGFLAATGLSEQQLTLRDIAIARNLLPADSRLGFDLGLALRIGMTAHSKAPSGLGPAGLAGYYIVMGMLRAEPHQKVAFVAMLGKNPAMKKGIELAIHEVQMARRPWWKKLLLLPP